MTSRYAKVLRRQALDVARKRLGFSSRLPPIRDIIKIVIVVGLKQFHHFVSLAAIFKPRWWAFVTRAPCCFKKVVPFTHLTLNWSCNLGEQNSSSWHFRVDMHITCYSQYFLEECPVVPQATMGTASEKFWSTFWDILTKFVEISLICILVCLVGREGGPVVFGSNIEQDNIMVAHAWYDSYVRNQGRNLSTTWPKSYLIYIHDN